MTTSVKEMYVIPKETYLNVMKSVPDGDGKKRDIEAINVDQVNVSCGPLLVGLKKFNNGATEEKEGKKNKRSVPPPADHSHSTSTIVKHIPSSVTASSNSSSRRLLVDEAKQDEIDESTVPPTIKTEIDPHISTPPLTDSKHQRPIPTITITPPPSAPPTKEVLGAEASVFKRLTDSSSSYYGDTERMFKGDSIGASAKSAIDSINDTILNRSRDSDNSQERLEIEKSIERSTKKPSSVKKLVGDFNAVLDSPPSSPTFHTPINDLLLRRRSSTSSSSPSIKPAKNKTPMNELPFRRSSTSSVSTSSLKLGKVPSAIKDVGTKPKTTSTRASASLGKPLTRTIREEQLEKKAKEERDRRRRKGETVESPKKKTKTSYKEFF